MRIGLNGLIEKVSKAKLKCKTLAEMYHNSRCDQKKEIEDKLKIEMLILSNPSLDNIIEYAQKGIDFINGMD